MINERPIIINQTISIGQTVFKIRNSVVVKLIVLKIKCLFVVLIPARYKDFTKFIIFIREPLIGLRCNNG